MTINTETEALIEFRKAMREFPGRTPCIQTGYRWAGRGIELKDGTRVVLETISIGGIRYTSKESIKRFIEAQNATQAASAAVSPKQRQRQSDAARRELEAMGV